MKLKKKTVVTLHSPWEYEGTEKIRFNVSELKGEGTGVVLLNKYDEIEYSKKSDSGPWVKISADLFASENDNSFSKYYRLMGKGEFLWVIPPENIK